MADIVIMCHQAELCFNKLHFPSPREFEEVNEKRLKMNWNGASLNLIPQQHDKLEDDIEILKNPRPKSLWGAGLGFLKPLDIQPILCDHRFFSTNCHF